MQLVSKNSVAELKLAQSPMWTESKIGALTGKSMTFYVSLFTLILLASCALTPKTCSFFHVSPAANVEFYHQPPTPSFVGFREVR